MTQGEVVVSNLIDAHASQYGYGVYRLKGEEDSTFYRVQLTSPEVKLPRVVVVSKEAFEETVRNNKLANSIILNLDSELREGTRPRNS